MNRSRLLSTIAAAAIGATLFSACGAITERAVEFGVERAVEADTGENFDLDLSGDGFRVSTDEGDFSVNVDGENGTVVFDGEDGSGAINFDSENGTIVFDGDEGSGAINFDEDGVTFNSDEGNGYLGINGGEVPANWPALVGVPASFDQQTALFSAFEEDGRGQYTMHLQQIDASYPAQLDARLTTAGFVAEAATDFAGLTTYRADVGSIEVITAEGNLTVLAKLDL